MKGNPTSRFLKEHGMISASLFYEYPNDSLIRRVSRVTRLILEKTAVPKYTKGPFYPSVPWSPTLPGDDRNGCGLKVSWTGRFSCESKDGNSFSDFIKNTDNEFHRRLLENISRDISSSGMDPRKSRYAHGGMHWVMNFKRLLKEGLSGTRKRIIKRLKKSKSIHEEKFCNAMLDTVDGLSSLAKRSHDSLKKAVSKKPSAELKRLVNAFKRVPEHPPETFYEALVSVHFFIYLGGGEPGRLDQYLKHFYTRDIKNGMISHKKAVELLDAHFSVINSHVTSPGAWHLTLGGLGRNGKASYNNLTRICLELNRKYRQPNTSLRIRTDMPEDLWDEILDNFSCGCGNPALVNDHLYCRMLPENAGVARDDLDDYAFGGCSETVVEGKSAVDAIGSTYNLLDILEASVGTHALACNSFASFLDAFKDDIRITVKELVTEANMRQIYFSQNWIDPFRTLFTDDCIDACKGYHEGGCRYNFEITVVYGIANVINGLYTMKKLYAGELKFSVRELMKAISSNFEKHPEIRAQLLKLEKFGNNNPELNSIARDITKFVFNEIRQYRCWRGNGFFLPASIGWVDFISLGKYIGATVDGRKNGTPLADSTGPVQGTDLEGPTATLLSTSAVAQDCALGTCILNLMLDKKTFTTPAYRDKIKALFKTYFQQGGLQLQVNVLDKAILKNAMKYPEKHGNIFVRIAGYNDYYVKQTKEIQKEILERTQHFME